EHRPGNRVRRRLRRHAITLDAAGLHRLVGQQEIEDALHRLRAGGRRRHQQKGECESGEATRAIDHLSMWIDAAAMAQSDLSTPVTSTLLPFLTSPHLPPL